MKHLQILTNLRISLNRFLRKHIVTCRFILRSGDKVWVNIIPNDDKIQTQQAEIDGFRAYGICYKNHPVMASLLYRFILRVWLPFGWVCYCLQKEMAFISCDID